MYYPTAVRVMPATREVLRQFDVKELRQYARAIGVRTGMTKDATIANLLASDKASICVSLFE